MGLAPPIAAEKTRDVFWHFEPALEVLWYVLAGISVLVFAYGVARPLAKYRVGRGGYVPPRSELPGRIREALGILFSHASIKRRDPYVGWAHRGIFYGFLVLFIGTVILAINTDFTEPVFGWRFFEGDFYLGYSIVLDVLGLALLAGLVLMMVRRGFGRRPGLRRDRRGRLGAVRRAARAVVVTRVAGAGVRRRHSLHEGHPHPAELRLAGAARPAGGQ